MGRSARHGRSTRPLRLTVVVDERHHYFPRRSSSAWAKYADAFLRISFARFSSTTSRCSRFSSARSSVVSPARRRVAFGLAYPPSERLSGAAGLRGDGGNRRPL